MADDYQFDDLDNGVDSSSAPVADNGGGGNAS